MRCQLITSGDEAFIEDAARFVVGAATIDRVGALHGMEPEQVLAILSETDMAARVERAAAEIERDGSAVRLRAQFLLYEALRRLIETVDKGECAPSFLLRLSEVMGKLSAEPKDDRKEANRPTFAINIDLGWGNSVSLKSVPLTLDAATGDLIASTPAPGRQV